MNLEGKVAIVTGASSGIGAEFSKILVESGTKVYGLARSMEKLNNVQEHIGNGFVPVQMDITRHEAVDGWVDSTFGKELPDILVNNAGLGYFANIDNLGLKEWQQMMDVNLSGVFYTTRTIVPLMKKNANVCHIVNIASIAGLMGNPTLSAYNATKFGLRGFSEALFKELRFDGIKVTCFFPGSIATNFFDSIETMNLHANMMQPSDIAKTLKFVLETSDNYLINELTMRPLNPKPPKE
ncbi:MAG: SDR family oxidoreductase [Balneolales bacterium]|nr:SDR family oxidoreductase [Balneolales bacterium]